MSGQYQLRKKKKKRVMRRAAILLVFLACITAASSWAYRAVDQKDIYQASDFQDSDMPDTVEINGIKCRPKTRLKTYLFMGIDTESTDGSEAEQSAAGQCDVLRLVVIDQNEDTYAVLPINRDTITEVKSLEDDGTYIATSEVQIALAHANGDGGTVSCENTVDAVSNLLYGQYIDGYAALSMDAISVLNHLAGGVTVTIEDDFSKVDPSMKTGETITLTDEQAVYYVRGRMNVGDGTNESRMRRQEQYLNALSEIFRKKFAEDESYVQEVYNALEDYMVTTLSGNDCSRLAKAMMENEPLGTLEIEGAISEDYLGYSQFIPDEDSLADTVIRLFYNRT